MNKKNIHSEGLSWNRVKRRKKIEDSFFLEFLIGNAEKGTYAKGYMEKGKKLILTCEDSVISTLVRKLKVTQKQASLSPPVYYCSLNKKTVTSNNTTNIWFSLLPTYFKT